MHEVLEAHEHVEHGHNPLTMPVTITLAVLALFVAVATLIGNGASKEELLLQSQEADQWAFFQAKNSGLRSAQSTVDLLAALQPINKELAAAIREKYAKEAERYTEEKAEAQKEAQSLRQERLLTARRGARYESAEVILEISLIICTFTLLTSAKGFWYAGMLLGAVGVVIGLSGFLLR
jgi:Domain of unknown function (DUF4337)